MSEMQKERRKRGKRSKRKCLTAACLPESVKKSVREMSEMQKERRKRGKRTKRKCSTAAYLPESEKESVREMSEMQKERRKRGKRTKRKCSTAAYLPESEKKSVRKKRRQQLKADTSAPDENTPCLPPPGRSPIEPPHSSSPTEPSRIGSADWCKCGKCVAMPTETESVCCKEIPKCSDLIPEGTSCIVDNDRFPVLCLSTPGAGVTRAILEVPKQMQQRANYNKHLRHVAYRAFTKWVHSTLGAKKRTPLPACAVSCIRNAYPDPPGSYTGFTLAQR